MVRVDPGASEGAVPNFGSTNIEVRVALVMTGGVSLAVWIGGVAAEVYRAKKKHGLYKLLLEELHSDVTVDVISGASAGGLNGVFLSAALSRDLQVDPGGSVARRALESSKADGTDGGTNPGVVNDEPR